jgi:hypothetical protein
MEEEIKTIEYTLRNILNKDEVSDYDVTVSLELLEKWKQLTNYKEPKSNSLTDYVDCLDEEPKKKNE